MSIVIEDFEAIYAHSSSVIAHFCDQLNVVNHINERVSWDQHRSEMSPGEAIKALVINLLVKREPLYRIDKFYETMDIPNLFSKAWEPSDFNDDRLGRSLEKLAKGNLPEIYYAIAWEALKKEGIMLKQVHLDTTSLSVQGAYERSALPESQLQIDFGHSKDLRPDLKQVMFGLGSVQGIPVFADVMAGNTSDKKWNGTFALQMKDLLPEQRLKEMIVVADSAMVTEDNLKIYKERPFISRFPENYSLCKELKDFAFSNETNWIPVGKLSDKKEAASYQIQEMTTELYGRPYRFVVVHSSALDKRKQKKIDREITKEQAILEKEIKSWEKVPYYCQQDAITQLEAFQSTKSKYHSLAGEVLRLETPKRRRGRPVKDEEASIEVTYSCKITLKPDETRIKRAREQESTFVLISNVPNNREASSLGLLKRYKGQIDVENLFRALKHPYFVHGVFLQNEARVLGLCYVFVIGLLIYALLQRRIRVKIAEEETPLKLYGKEFHSPTGKTILEQFDHVLVIEYQDPETLQMKKFVKISETAKLLLHWLG